MLENQNNPSNDIFDQLGGFFIKIIAARSNEDINELLTLFISKKVKILESVILNTESVASGFLVDISNNKDSELNKRLTYLLEEGIIDWALKSKEPQMIMDLQSQLSGNLFNILLIPLVYDNNSIGIYIALTDSAKENVDSPLLNDIRNFSFLSALVLSNIALRNSLITLENKHLELNERFINILPLTSIGEISLTVLKEVSLPLQIIDSNIDLIENGVGNLSRRLEIIKQQIKSITEIINLLDEISAEAKKSAPEEIDIGSMLAETLSILSSQLKSAGTKVYLDSSVEKPITKGIKTQLEFIMIQIINFLITNSNDTDSIYINISSPNQRIVVITIREETKGIEFDNYESLLEFIKGSSVLKDMYQNFLSFRHILKLHKGKLECSAVSDDGTVFRIYLPKLSE